MQTRGGVACSSLNEAVTTTGAACDGVMLVIIVYVAVHAHGAGYTLFLFPSPNLPFSTKTARVVVRAANALAATTSPGQ